MNGNNKKRKFIESNSVNYHFGYPSLDCNSESLLVRIPRKVENNNVTQIIEIKWDDINKFWFKESNKWNLYCWEECLPNEIEYEIEQLVKDIF